MGAVATGDGGKRQDAVKRAELALAACSDVLKEEIDRRTLIVKAAKAVKEGKYSIDAFVLGLESGTKEHVLDLDKMRRVCSSISGELALMRYSAPNVLSGDDCPSGRPMALPPIYVAPPELGALKKGDCKELWARMKHGLISESEAGEIYAGWRKVA